MDRRQFLVAAACAASCIVTARPLNAEEAKPNEGVYVTGFGPYDTVTENPSEYIVRDLQKKGYDVEILPVTSDTAPRRLREIIRAKKPRVLISLGHSFMANYLQVDTVTHEWQYRHNIDDIKDVLEAPRTMRIDDKKFSNIVEKFVKNDIRYELNNKISGVCGSVMFEGLFSTQGTGIEYYFLHIPRDAYTNIEKRGNILKAVEVLSMPND